MLIASFGPNLSSTPRNRWESSGGSLRDCSHRNLTSPPSLWPGRELRKYHCSCPPSSPNPVQLGIFSRMNRSSRCWGSWRSAGQAIADRDVLLKTQDFLMTGYSVFKVHEKTKSRSALLWGFPENLSSQGVGIEKAVFAPLP